MGESSKSRPNEYAPATDYHYLKFENRCLRASGDDFQNLFEAIMVRAQPGKFERVRPYGKYGDRKCDGLIEAEGIIFQVYSPDELKQAEVQKKIDEDLEGAVQHWQDILKKWVFVYNARRGTTADIKRTLQQKRQQYPDIEIDCWSNDYLWEVARCLSVTQRNEIFGLPPSSSTEIEQVATLLVNRQDYEINWREICRNPLSFWKGLTTNALMGRSGVRFQLDKIFVPLGVVERREQSKYRSNDGASAEKGSELYEEKITPISQDDFFEQVLRQQQSKYSQGKRIAIIGEPGAGKTTQLQKIGDWILKETDGIPIWIPLAEVRERKLREYLLSDWLQTAIGELEVSPEHREELGQLLKTGKVWLLLDGVDEMAISDALHQIATQMREGWLQNVRVVLTCRLNVWDAGKNALDGFDVYRNLDFEYPTEVHQLVDKWFATEPALRQKLKVALEQPGKERIRDMVKNPLRLTLLCYSWQLRQGELPETKAGLYEWFVDTFYEWNKGKVPIQLSTEKRDELNQALGELAKEAIDQESSRFRLREKFVNQFLGAANDKDSLFDLALKLNCLNRIGVAEENPLERVYAFLHPTFQEYFAALVIDDGHYFLPFKDTDQSSENLVEEDECYRIFEPQWIEVVLFWLGLPQVSNQSKQVGNQNRENLIRQLMNFQDTCAGIHSFRAYFLAVEGIKEFRDYSELELTLSKTVEYAFGFGNKGKWFLFLSPISQNAIRVIRLNIDNKMTRKFLIQLLDKCPDPKTRWYIAITLEMLGETSIKTREILQIGYSQKLLPTQRAKHQSVIAKIHSQKHLELEIPMELNKQEFDLNNLIDQVKQSDNWLSVIDATEKLCSMKKKSQLCQIIQSLKSCWRDGQDDLFYNLESQDFRWQLIYKIIWHCSQYLSYPDFFNAWHSSSLINDA
ncbi:NACHT domain-containing protein [Alkalinema pantanalense CENA528]|uniref:NACHT domain-containing protein n=1 Tax=Alkalinema pantanalense TaxID=1620705 RepID=UPI003D6F5694